MKEQEYLADMEALIVSKFKNTNKAIEEMQRNIVKRISFITLIFIFIAISIGVLFKITG